MIWPLLSRYLVSFCLGAAYVEHWMLGIILFGIIAGVSFGRDIHALRGES